MREFLRRTYRGIGLHAAPPGTLLHRLDRQLRYRFARRLPAAGVTVAARMLERPDTDGVLVAFKIGGGIGDHLIAARYIRDLMAAAGRFRFDIYSARPDVADWVFAAIDGFNVSYDDYFLWDGRGQYRWYPLAMWLSQFVVIYYEEARWLEIRAHHPRLIKICTAIDRFRSAREMNDVIVAHPRLDTLLGLKAVYMGLNRYSLAHAMSGIAYGGHTLPIARAADARQRFGLLGRRYMTIHNGFDAEFQTGSGVATRSTKVYPHFSQMLASLRGLRPGLTLVQLGTTTSRPIAGVDLSLVQQTTLAETAEIIAGATLHIDNEGGLVHLAACLGTPSCVLFGPTPSAYFGYDQNINVSPGFCGGCWWITKDWMTTCPRGFGGPKCLVDINPTAVAAAIAAWLDRQAAQSGPESEPQPDMPAAVGVDG